MSVLLRWAWLDDDDTLFRIFFMHVIQPISFYCQQIQFSSLLFFHSSIFRNSIAKRLSIRWLYTFCSPLKSQKAEKCIELWFKQNGSHKNDVNKHAIDNQSSIFLLHAGRDEAVVCGDMWPVCCWLLINRNFFFAFLNYDNWKRLNFKLEEQQKQKQNPTQTKAMTHQSYRWK